MYIIKTLTIYHTLSYYTIKTLKYLIKFNTSCVLFNGTES